jgi:predicted dienelactone hydrolase
MKTVFLLWLTSAFLTPASSTVGFQQLSVPDPPGKTLSAAVWFPSVGTPVSVSVGPFQQMVVPDGAVSGTRLPVVLISHGTSGSEGSHYDTAMALAANGFVVVALTL